MSHTPTATKNRRPFIVVGISVVIVTILLGIFLLAILPIKANASVQAEPISWLFDVHIWLIAFLFALVSAFMVYSIIVHRRKGDDTSEGEHFEGNTMLEIVWTVVPLVLVIIFAFIGIQTLNAATSGGDEVQVHAIGRQWSWSFEYPTGQTTAELVLPVNKPALITLTAEDVIHSFWVPEFGPKQDLVPGRTTSIHITPDKEGEYKLVCAELCGTAHWSMQAVVKVVPEAEYTAWLQGQAVQTASR
jgi:cytochrome c oxidase subunit 2